MEELLFPLQPALNTTEGTVKLESGSSYSGTPTIVDGTALNLLVCGGNAPIASPGPAATQNDFAAGTPHRIVFLFNIRKVTIFSLSSIRIEERVQIITIYVCRYI